MNIVPFPGKTAESTSIAPAYRAGNRHSINMYGEASRPAREESKPQYDFWNLYFNAREAKIIADTDFKVRYGSSSLRERLTLKRVQSRMHASKEPFTLGEVLGEVQQEMTRRKLARPLRVVDGGRRFRRLGEANIPVLSLVEKS